MLLLVGVLLIAMPLYQTYNIFTGSSLPPQIFKAAPISAPATEANNPFDIQQQVQKGIMDILPIALINNTLNLTSWMILMALLMFGGSLLASIGIKLIK